MAKKNDGAVQTKGRIKIRYFEVEVDGDTEAMQDGLRALTTALNRPASNSGGRALPSQRSPSLIEGNIETGEAALNQDDLIDDLDQPANEELAAVVKKPSRPKSAPPTPTIKDDIDFESVAVPWKDFAKQKAPDSDMQKIAVIATWFKRYGNLNQINIHHAYTAYKMVGWPTPNDMGQTFRNVKKAHDWFKTDGSGNWEINIIGLNHVEDKMGKANE